MSIKNGHYIVVYILGLISSGHRPKKAPFPVLISDTGRGIRTADHRRSWGWAESPRSPPVPAGYSRD